MCELITTLYEGNKNTHAFTCVNNSNYKLINTHLQFLCTTLKSKNLRKFRFFWHSFVGNPDLTWTHGEKAVPHQIWKCIFFMHDICIESSYFCWRNFSVWMWNSISSFSNQETLNSETHQIWFPEWECGLLFYWFSLLLDFTEVILYQNNVSNHYLIWWHIPLLCLP